MARFDPVRSPVLDTLVAHRRPAERVEPRPRPAVGWARLAVAGLASLAAVMVFQFPRWAVLALPPGALAAQSLRGRRWAFRAACSVVLAAYAAQAVQLTLFTWPFRFAASFALFMAAAFCWGLRADELD